MVVGGRGKDLVRRGFKALRWRYPVKRRPPDIRRGSAARVCSPAQSQLGDLIHLRLAGYKLSPGTASSLHRAHKLLGNWLNSTGKPT
jgi:hypothetical protein